MDIKEHETRTDLRVYSFDNVIGNVTNVNLLRKAIINGKFPKLVIMAGYAGTGKSTCADIAGMALTCEHPVNGNPCLECRSCKENLQSITTTGQSRNLVKKNLGKLKTKKDVADIIQEIFVLQAPIGTNVYELGEAHCWSAEDQTALLEEIDRLDDNTVIILTTTKGTKLIPELRSRGIMFNFNRLNKTESKLLFDQTCSKLGINKVDKELENAILHYSRGIPRDMVNIMDFINEVSPDINEIKAFLNIIDDSLFTDLISAMHKSLKESVVLLDYMFNTYSYDMIIEQFKDYFVKVLFFITGGIQSDLSKKDCEILRNILTPDTVYSVSKLLQDMHDYTSEADTKMQFIKIRQAIVKKKIGSIVAENNKNASSQHVKATRLYNESKNIKEESKKVKSAQLSKDNLMKILGDNKNNTSVVNNSTKSDKQPKDDEVKTNSPNNSGEMNIF